jgi:hypothetical protein
MSDSPGGWLRWMAIAAGLCAILILPVAWDASQGWIFPDSTSYLDMASDAVRDSPAVLLKNAYWSPAYPAILALMMAVVRPSLAAEVPAAYILHWLIFLVTTTCFSLLVGTFLQWLRRNSWPELAGDGALVKALVCFGYAFFLLSNMNQTLWYLTPDMLLQGLVYLAAACALRLFLPDSSWKHSAALGLTLGLGYLAKAAMFPVALLLLGILFLRPPKDHLGRRHSAIALVCFCLATTPLVLSLSHEKHRFTFGDSGKLNYAYHVGDLPKHAGWTGQNPENGTPAHAPRKLSGAPLILEFRTPVSGTQPLWYDPSYWWEGLRVPINVQRQLSGLFNPFRQVHSTQTLFLALAAALAPLCLLNFRIRKAIRDGGIQIWILILWPAAACLMYALVLFSFRYVAGYIVLACLGAVALLLQPFQGATRTRALFAAALLLAVAGTVRLRPVLRAALRAPDGGFLTREEGRDNGPSSAAVARELAQLGIRPGDEISVLGTSLDCYYARLARVRIVAQIWEDPDQIAGLSAPQVRQVLTQLKQIGVKALVSRSKPGFVNDEGWIAIPRTDVYVRML